MTSVFASVVSVQLKLPLSEETFPQTSFVVSFQGYFSECVNLYIPAHVPEADLSGYLQSPG